MIDLKKYNLTNEDIIFLKKIEDWCTNGQNEIILEYKKKSFVLEPRGKAIQVYGYGNDLGYYNDFDDLLLNYKIDNKPLIELIPYIDFGD